MNDWRLQEHGDAEELRWWPLIEPRFPNYETLWAGHVAPLTFRVLNPDVIFVRPSVPEHLREVATANYSVFWHLAKGHALLEDPGFFEDRRGLFYLYSHLYSVCELVPRFLSATNRTLRHYNVSIIPDTGRRLRRFGDVSLADDFEQFCEMIARGYRGGLTHNYGHISIGGAVPLPDRVDDYMDLGIVASLVMDEGGEITLQLDFVENQVRQAEQDIEELESILNRIWAVVLEELNAVVHRDDYRRDQNMITREEEQFADHFDEPATSGEAQSWHTGAHTTSGSALGRSQSGSDDDE